MWSSLEIAKLFVGSLTPLAAFVFGLWAKQIAERLEETRMRSEALIEARLRTFDKLSPLINDMLCYCTLVGHWKELSPPDIIIVKREADKLFGTLNVIFSKALQIRYKEFFDSCFEIEQEEGKDAMILADSMKHKSYHRGQWDSELE